MPRYAAVRFGADTMDDRHTTRVTVNITPAQADELRRIAKRLAVSYSWLLRLSLERTIEEANGGRLLPLTLPGEDRHAA